MTSTTGEKEMQNQNGAQAFDPFGLDLEQPTLVLVMPSRWRTR